MLNELLFFFSTLGWFNGLILSVYFLFFYKNRKLSGILFGLMLLALSIRVAKSVLWWFNPKLPILVIQIGLAACLFIGPLLLFYVRASSNGIKEMPRKWNLWLAAHALVVVVVLVFFSNRTYIPLWRSFLIPFIYTYWFLHVVIVGFELKSSIHLLFTKPRQLKPNEWWVVGVYVGNFLIAATYVLSYISPWFSYIGGPLSFTLLLYLNALILLNRRRTNDLFQSEPEKYASKKIDDVEAVNIIKRLEAVMKDQQVYVNPALKLNDLAAMVHISGHQLSQLLNDNMGKSFTMYLNDYRIQRACDIILSNTNLKLEAVGYEVGFNTKSTFFAAFKKHTGTTPKQFKEQQG